MEEKKYICIENEQTFTESELYDLYREYLDMCGLSDALTFGAWKMDAFGKNGTLETIEEYNKRMSEIEW